MSRQRFRNLELGKAAAPPSPDGHEPQRSQRALELKHGLELDTSGLVRTNFCRRCRAESPEGAPECHACGAALGGPDQEAFDAEMRDERARRREEDARADGERALPAALRRSPPAPELRRGGGSLFEPPRGVPELEPPAADADEPGFGTVIATGVLVAATFALVSMPVRLILAAYAGEPAPSRAFGEILLCAGLSLAVWWRFRRSLRRL